MPKVKVPQFRSVRSVLIETDATKGAVVGVNLYDADGNLADLDALIAAAVADTNSPAPGQGQDLTTDDVTEGRYNLYYTDDRVRAVLGRTIVGFSFGDASPRTIYAVPDDRLAYLVRLVIDTPFDGAGAAIAVGTADDAGALMPTDANDPTVVTSYEFASNADLSLGDAVQLTITPGSGATQGAGRIILDAYQR